MRRWLAGFLCAIVAAMAPAGAMAGNQELADRVALALKQSGQLHDYRIAVMSQNGTAWLKGEVTSQEQVHAALQVAFEVRGVTRVVNRLAVRTDGTSHTVERPIASPSSAPALQPVAGAISVPEPRRRAFREMRPQPVPSQPGQTALDSRLPWARDIAVRGPLTPLSADPHPLLQTSSIDTAKPSPAGEVEIRDDRPVERRIRQ